MRKKIITVNDTFQKGYTYELTDTLNFFHVHASQPLKVWQEKRIARKKTSPVVPHKDKPFSTGPTTAGRYNELLK